MAVAVVVEVKGNDRKVVVEEDKDRNVVVVVMVMDAVKENNK